MFVTTSGRQFLSLAAAMLMLAWGASNVRAVLLGYEGFDYTDGETIVGKTGGDGWSNAWNKTGNTASSENATNPGLAYPTLPVAGNKVNLVGQQNATANGSSAFIFRSLDHGFGGGTNSAWISFIGQRTGSKAGTAGVGGTPSYQRIFGLSFFDGPTVETFAVGELSNPATNDPDTWALSIFPLDLRASSAIAIDTESFLLARIDFGAAANTDDAYLWINPDLSQGEPTIGTANATLTNQNLSFDRVRVSAGGSQNLGASLAASGLIDEIRIGTNFDSVTNSSIVAGAGDVNGDGVVDITDYETIRDNFQMTGATWDDGDLSGDGLVNLIDFRMWKDSRDAGTGATGGTAGTTPEPATTILWLLGMFALGAARLPRRK